MPGLPPPPAGESPIPQNGQISGHLSYPSEFIPPLDVAAIRIGGGPSDYYTISTPQNQAEYFLSVPAGDYYILSYISGGDLAGGYTQMVPCGLSAECTDHSLIPVHVDPGAVVTGIDPGDWYAPEGSFPPNPLP